VNHDGSTRVNKTIKDTTRRGDSYVAKLQISHVGLSERERRGKICIDGAFKSLLIIC